MRIALCGYRQNGFYEDVCIGVREWLRENPAFRLAVSLNGAGGRVSHRSDLSTPENLRNMSIDGYIFAWVQPESLATLPDLPCVCYSNLRPGMVPGPHVVNDDVACGRLAARTLVDCGYNHFYIIHCQNRIGELRTQGFLGELAALGRSCTTIPSFSDSLPELPRLDPAFQNMPPNAAVFSPFTNKLRDFIQQLREIGEVPGPETLGLLAGDPPDTDRREEGVAFVVLKGREIGRHAAEMLRDALVHKKPNVYSLTEIAPTEVNYGTTLRRNAGQQLLARIQEFCNAHLAENILVDDIARKLGMSRRNLEKQSRLHGLPPPAEILTETRMRHAERLLCETTLSIENICDQIGYCERSAFAKRFRLTRGMAPSRYRKVHQKNP